MTRSTPLPILAVGILLGILAFTATATAPSPSPSNGLATDQAAANSEVAVWLLGDSLCVLAYGAGQLGPALDAQFGDRWERTCRIGEALGWGIEQVGSREKVPPVVVVELGTNRMANLELFDTSQKLLAQMLFERGARQVVWLTAHTAWTSLYYSQNDITRANATTEGFLVSDWASFVEPRNWFYLSDDVHHNFAGRAAFSDHVVAAALLGQRASQRGGPAQPVLDQVLIGPDGAAELRGWFYGDPETLRVSVDGLVVGPAEVLATTYRPDVATAVGHSSDPTGFVAVVDLPDRRTRVCVSVDGDAPFGNACHTL